MVTETVYDDIHDKTWKSLPCAVPTLSSSGSVTAQQLYGPYGSVRYQSGTMPTAHGYTGQIADAATGLD